MWVCFHFLFGSICTLSETLDRCWTNRLVSLLLIFDFFSVIRWRNRSTYLFLIFSSSINWKNQLSLVRKESDFVHNRFFFCSKKRIKPSTKIDFGFQEGIGIFLLFNRDFQLDFYLRFQFLLILGLFDFVHLSSFSQALTLEILTHGFGDEMGKIVMEMTKTRRKENTLSL